MDGKELMHWHRKASSIQAAFSADNIDIGVDVVFY